MKITVYCGLVLLLAATGGASDTRNSSASEFAVCAARVWTMAGPPQSPGCVHVRNGKVVAIEAAPPSGVVVRRYPNAEITPGLIDIHTHITLRGAVGGAGEQNERSESFAPELRIIDSLDPWDPAIAHAVSGGVTTALITPGSIGIVSGQSVIVKLKSPPLERMIVMEPAGIKATTWRPETYALFDKWLTDCKLALEGKGDQDDPRLSAGILLLKREIPLIVHGGYPTGELEPILAIVDKYHLRLIVYHCETCDEDFEELQARHVPVVVGPRLLYWHNGKDTNIASLLVHLGIKVAFSCDASDAELKYLRDQAGLAVHYGMSPEEALKAITINPAEIVGLSNRIGSLAPGRDADFVVFSGPVFAAKTKVLKVVIDGVPEYVRPQ